jgi:acyl transferase domain-containing protein/NADPH:quinone reductase-like Zn-dependent oxidoreductase
LSLKLRETHKSPRFLSADGKSYAFDSRASGYGRGEGVATLVLKRLKDALAEGDPIRAVIRESLLNQDGKTETITTPSLEAQEALIRGCYRKAGLDPRGTQYFEAHGTGTQAGDTVEARAIGTVFKPNPEPLLIGSIKTNIGHTEAASGLGSIIKTALAMEKGVIPPSINFEKPNPKLSLEAWNLKLVRNLQEWPACPTRRASINNFGYGGSNAHIIMEDSASWVPVPCSGKALTNGHVHGHSNEHLNGHLNGVMNGEHAGTNGHAQLSHLTSKVLVLSAKDELACKTMSSNLSDFLERNKPTLPDAGEFLQSLAYTLGQRRTRFPWTAALTVPTTEGIDAVIQLLRSPKIKPSRSSRRPRIGLVFTGQGAQWYAMGRELIGSYPVYTDSLREAEGYLREFGADWSLVQELSREPEDTRINEVALSTPICVALQISLVRLLRAWGVVPVAVTSHSSGEIAAAYAAGALSYRDAMAYSYHRAVLAADQSLRGTEKGGMIAVGLGLEETESYLKRLKSGGKAVVACVNSPSSITVAGDLSAVKELEELANADGIFARRLKVDTAWHSHHMAPIANVYIEALERAQTNDHVNNALESVAFSSPVTGGRVTNAKIIARPEHWAESLVQPVQFVDAFTDMVLGDAGSSASNVDVIVEVGPHTALGGPIQQILALPEFKDLQIPYYGCLVRKTDARDSMQALAASLLQEGYPVDMEAVNFPHGRDPHVKVLTDLPPYPWNHQIKHWVEPRFNRALRERSQPAHDLLGSLVEGCNPATPSWRHILRISEAPWTRDHVIQSNVVYPAAGYICLAIEAIKQLTATDQSTSGKEVSGYRLRDVDFLQALMIPDNSDGIEVQTTMRPVSDKDVATRGWKHFDVWSVTADNRWTQHAKGLISIELEQSSSEAVKTAVSDRRIKGYPRRVLPADLFANLRALGIAHGPMFQNMKSIVQSGSEMRSEVTVAVADTSVPNNIVRDNVLHPVTLDSIITAPYSAVHGAAARETAAKVPRSVDYFWVSSKIGRGAGHLFKAHSALVRDDSQGMTADVLVSDDSSEEVVLKMKGLSYQSLGRSASLRQTEAWETEFYNNVNWSLDISVGSPATFAAVQKQLIRDVDISEVKLTRDLRRVCYYFMQRALLALRPSDVDRMDHHHAKYYTWMKDTVERAASGQLSISSAELLSDDETESQRRIDRVAEARVDGEMICRLGAHLVATLRGETIPHDLVTQDDLLTRFQSETPRAKRTGSQLSGLLRHLTHKNPRARILEIGAGSGETTRYALDALGTADSGGPHASLYHYTNKSAASLQAAPDDFLPWSDLLSFDVLDIEQDPASQGFTTGTYDVVIASRVISASQSVSQALGNVRSLLKPGGSLVIVEDVQQQVDVQFVQGLLLGRESGGGPELEVDSPSCTAAWHHHLRDAGFTGLDIELRDCESTENFTSVTMLSTVSAGLPKKLRADSAKTVIITSDKAGSPPSSWLKSVQESIAACTEGKGGLLPAVQSLESTAATASWYADKICIFIGEIDEPILYDLDSASLEGIRAMSTNCKGLLWVTRGGAVDCERPELGLAPGFVRSLRNEYVGRKLLTLDLDSRGQIWSETSASAIVQVLRSAFGNPEDGGPIAERGPTEFEYAERDGLILVPRFYHDVARDRTLSPKAPDPSTPKIAPLGPLYQPNRPLCWHADSLAFGDDAHASDYQDILPPNLIEVEPRAYGATLRATDERVVGVECSGTITRVGSQAAAQGYAAGDRVLCVLRQSSFPSRAIVEWTSSTGIPPGLSFQEASSLPAALLTAYISLVDIARLKGGQSVLIHSAADAVGQAAIMIAQHLAAEVFATVGSPEEQKLITQKYGIPGEHILSSLGPSFGPAILSATRGRGVDVVLNSLAGSLLQESLNVVAPFGHFVEIGRRDVEGNSNLELRPFARSITFSAVDLSSLLEHRGADVHRSLREVMRLVEAKAVRPVHPITAYAMADITQALSLLQTGRHPMGKVILTVDPQEMVPVLPRTRTAKLSPEATYLIVGGNGGLGQSVAHWLVSRGARNLALLSRSAATSEKTAALAKELRDTGCDRVLPVSGDVAVEDDLARAIDTCAQEGLPPIRGVIHAAFVLHVSADNQEWSPRACCDTCL